MTKPEIHEMIKDLRRNAPRLLARAKIRADRLAQHNRIECPICATGAVMDILHAFQPDEPHTGDPMLGLGLHIKCNACEHEDYITIVSEDTQSTSSQ